MKHNYNESANLTENCDVTFDTNDCPNFPLNVPMIGMEGMVIRILFRYTRDYLTLGIRRPISPLPLKIDSITRQSPRTLVIK